MTFEEYIHRKEYIIQTINEYNEELNELRKKYVAENRKFPNGTIVNSRYGEAEIVDADLYCDKIGYKVIHPNARYSSASYVMEEGMEVIKLKNVIEFETVEQQ